MKSIKNVLKDDFFSLFTVVLLTYFLSALYFYRGVYTASSLFVGFVILWAAIHWRDVRGWAHVQDQKSWAVPRMMTVLFVVIQWGNGAVGADSLQASLFVSLWLIGLVAARLSSRILQNLLIYIPAACFIVQLVYFFFADDKASFFWAHRLVLATDHPGVLAVLCVIPVCATLWKFQRAFAWMDVLAGIALPLTVLFFTYARASMLGLFVVFCLAALLNRRFRKIALVSFAVVTLCGIVFMPAQQKERFGQTLREPLHQKTFLSRLPIWEAALDGIAQHPLLGNTQKSFRGHFERYVQEHRAELKSKYTFVEATQYHAHNIYLGLVYNWGGVGFVLIAGLAGYALWTSGKMGLGYVWNCLLFLAVYGCFEFPFHRKDGAFLFFFALGLAYGRYAVWPRLTGASVTGTA